MLRKKFYSCLVDKHSSSPPKITTCWVLCCGTSGAFNLSDSVTNGEFMYSSVMGLALQKGFRKAFTAKSKAMADGFIHSLNG